MTPFTRDDFDRANAEWGANCGPGAVAAIMGMTLDEVRPHMGDFERKHYTNPSLMNAVLRSIGRPWRKIGAVWPSYGLVRVQWEGPWTAPGVPMRARYRYTHWIGCYVGYASVGIFDINAMANGTGWCSRDDWAESIVPYILKQYPRASGAWHITHGIEVDRSGKKIARTVLTFPGDADLELHPITTK
jgi:hypothetical protein